MDPFGFNPAFPFPVPTTAPATGLNLHLQPPMPDLHHPHPQPELSLTHPPPPDPQVVKEAATELNVQPAAAGHSSHRKRGRPRKLKPTTEPNFEPAAAVVEPAANNANADDVPAGEVAAAVVPEKRAARPVKRFGSELAHKDVAMKKKKMGRKALLKGPLGYPKRGPGRPPKSRSVSDVFNGPVNNALAVPGMKRRGRPKRSQPDRQGDAASVPKSTGWHPNKAGSRLLGPVDPQWMVDYAQVRAKIDHIQSRMRDAIGVIKPHLMNQIMTSGQIGTALQELDQLSTMDVMAVSLGGLVEEPEVPAETQLH